MPPNHFESEVESFLEGSHGDRTHNKQRADHHTVTPLCGTLLPAKVLVVSMGRAAWPAKVLLVSMSPRCRALCAKNFSLRDLMWA